MKAFFDTNVLVYRVDFREPAKRAVAERLIDAAVVAGTAILSTQTLIEFYNSVTRKLGMPSAHAKVIAEGYGRIPLVTLTAPLIFAAMDRHAGGQFSFWDALIVEAALAGGAKVLYTEDMQDGLVVDGLTITNPFLGA